MTPADVYFGRAEMRQTARQKVMATAFDTHPERKWPSQGPFTHGLSIVAGPPGTPLLEATLLGVGGAQVWLNPPPSAVAELTSLIP